jgi:hypothetical protein
MKRVYLLVEQILNRWHHESSVSLLSASGMVCIGDEDKKDTLFPVTTGSTYRGRFSKVGGGGAVRCCVIRKALIIRCMYISLRLVTTLRDITFMLLHNRAIYASNVTTHTCT